MGTLDNYIDYFYDPERGHSALLKLGAPPYTMVSGAKSAEEARQLVLQKAQDPKRTEKSPRS